MQNSSCFHTVIERVNRPIKLLLQMLYIIGFPHSETQLTFYSVIQSQSIIFMTKSIVCEYKILTVVSQDQKCWEHFCYYRRVVS
jgi:hypothetical protein